MSWYKKAAQFWGKSGSGMLYVCLEDQTMLLVLRSNEVEDPGTWGIPGGAIVGTEGMHDSSEGENFDIETSRYSAELEAEEELGCRPQPIKELGTTNYRFGNFNYVTFVVAVSSKEKKRLQTCISLNWENDKWDWFPINRPPAGLHFGVEHTVTEHQLFQPQAEPTTKQDFTPTDENNQP